MKYSANHYRRFTFFLESNSKEIIQYILKCNKALLNTVGILNIEVYCIEIHDFFIFEVSPKRSIRTLKKAIENVLNRIKLRNYYIL